MHSNDLVRVNTLSRYLLGFLFIYHGLVPKILWLSPDEVQLVSASNLGLPAAIVLPLAGVCELLLGFAIVLARTAILPVYLAAFSLLSLLIYIALTSPGYLVAAFNPVTTNILGLGLCYLVVLSQSTRRGLAS